TLFRSETRKVLHLERPHSQPEVAQRCVDLSRRAASQKQLFSLRACNLKDAVADEAIADPRTDRHLARLLCKLEAARQHVDGRLRSRHDLQQLHDVCGAEEMQADKPLRVRQTLKDELWVEIGGVGGQYRLFGTDLGKFRKHGALDIQVLKHGLDHQITIRDV